jgi:hypothetical protein
MFSCPLSKNLKIKIYKTVIVPVDLYECGTWSLPLREEHRLRVPENRMLRRYIWTQEGGSGRRLQKTA